MRLSEWATFHGVACFTIPFGTISHPLRVLNELDLEEWPVALFYEIMGKEGHSYKVAYISDRHCMSVHTPNHKNGIQGNKKFFLS